VVVHGSHKALLQRFFDAYFYLFYGTTFLLNFLNVLTFLIPLLVAEEFARTGEWRLFISQFFIMFYVTYLYSTIYVVNDIVDFQHDIEHKVVKSSLIVRHRSIKVGFAYLTLLLTSFVVAFVASPRLAPAFLAYCGCLVVLALVHSYAPALKPITFFIERASRFLAPSFFIYYDVRPRMLTILFVIASVVAYPVVMHREFLEYLEIKRRLASRAREICAWTYSTYALASLVVLSLTVAGGRALLIADTSRPVVLGEATLSVATLLIFYYLVIVLSRWASDLSFFHRPSQPTFLTMDRRFLLFKTGLLVGTTALLFVITCAD